MISRRWIQALSPRATSIRAPTRAAISSLTSWRPISATPHRTPSPLAFNTARTFSQTSPIMSAPKIDLMKTSVQDGVAVISYDIPPANTLSKASNKALIESFKWALSDSAVKVIVLTGEGKFFSTGLNLSDVPAEGAVLPDDHIELLR